MRHLIPIVALVAASPAGAFDQRDTTAMQAVIAGQIAAFQKDDAAGAYAFASPGIQQIFPSESVFIEMVRRGYAPVYRPRSYSFGEVREGPNGPVQAVRILDAGGESWLALYTMERQDDGSWRISGCVLVKDEARGV